MESNSIFAKTKEMGLQDFWTWHNRSGRQCPSDLDSLVEELPLPPTKPNCFSEVKEATVKDYRRRLGVETSWLEGQLRTAHYPRLSRILYPPSKDKLSPQDRSKGLTITPSKLLK